MRNEAVHAALVAEQMREEPHRLACEARHVAAMDWKRRTEYLADVSKLRGPASAELLRAAVAEVQT